LFAIDPALRERLDRAGVAWCVIGGCALAARGYARFTADVDLLTMDGRVLEAEFWEGGESPELRIGDWEDPLRGVVRFHGEADVDLIVGVGHAMRFAVKTAEVHPTVGLPVATPLALVLLKLEAGGPVDRSDIIGLVDTRRQLGDDACRPPIGGLDCNPPLEARRELMSAPRRTGERTAPQRERAFPHRARPGLLQKGRRKRSGAALLEPRNFDHLTRRRAGRAGASGNGVRPSA